MVNAENLRRAEENNATRLCFTKFNWFFQDECMMCETTARCARATHEKRMKMIETIHDAINHRINLERATEIVHPKILESNYNFFED